MPSRDTTLSMVRGSFDFRADFCDWLAENWGIWLRFCEEADKIRRTGRARYAARTIVEFIRHETALRETNSAFKVNDWYTPYMARLYLAIHPEAEGFFETRERTAA